MCNPVTTHDPLCLESKGEHRGFQWEVVVNPNTGFRCGYVRVPKGHPWHGKGYEQVDAEVHGGLTFAEPDTECGLGGEDNAWWLGFDCGHLGDGSDYSLMRDPAARQIRARIDWDVLAAMRRDFPDYQRPVEEVRSREYVEAECKALANQAAEVA